MALLTPQRDGPGAPIPLIVDLDEALLRTDATLESLCVLARRDPLRLAQLPVWLSGGRAQFKRRLSETALPEVRTLPYRSDLLEYLRAQRLSGRRLILVTDADTRLSEAIGRQVGVFERVIANDGALRGQSRRDRLVREFGSRGFDYAGAHRRDYPVWCAARNAVLVSPSRGLLRRVERATPIERIFPAQPTTLRAVLHELRPHHWVKNLLILVPVSAAHRLYAWDWVVPSLLAFVAFSLCASSVYLLNDLLDLGHDREHPDKKGRMVASGEIRPTLALELLVLLMLLSLGVSVFLPAAFAWVLSAYFLLMMAYSLRLKQVPILDVAILTVGYALRVVAGALATAIALSSWVLAFISLLFFSFTLVKRCGELARQVSMGRADAVHLYGYSGADVSVLMALGVASGYLSVLVMALYTNTAIGEGLFPHHEFFWGLCALLFYWISHMWLAVAQGRMHHDPVVFAFIDPVSRWLFAAMALVTAIGLL